MRIGLVIYDSLNTVSGGYLYDRQLVRALRDAGDEVEIISLPGSSYDRHILYNSRPTLARRLRYGRYDILLQDELNHPSLYLINEQLRRQTSFPIISIVHHLRSSERHPVHQMPRYRQLERRYLRSIDGFIYNSETTRSTVESSTGFSRPNVVVHPAADHVQATVSAEQIAHRAQREGPLRILFAGNVIPRKGLHTLLAALSQLPVTIWELAIVGDLAVDNAYVDNVRHWTRTQMQGARISWHGQLADDALWRLMAGSDMLVVPSTYEGFGIVYLEGMAFGLPAIATTAGAAAEMITDSVNGFLIAPDDARQLARHLRTMHDNRRLLSRMSLAALAHFQASLTWSQGMSAVRRFLLQMRREY